MKLSRRNLLKAIGGGILAALTPKVDPVEAIGEYGGYVVPEPLASETIKRFGGLQAFWQGEALVSQELLDDSAVSAEHVKNELSRELVKLG